MTNVSNERLDRVEANLDRFAALLVQTAERQSVREHLQGKTDVRIDKMSAEIDRILTLVAADCENIRALARIAEAHERLIEDIEQAEG